MKGEGGCSRSTAPGMSTAVRTSSAAAAWSPLEPGLGRPAALNRRTGLVLSHRIEVVLVLVLALVLVLVLSRWPGKAAGRRGGLGSGAVEVVRQPLKQNALRACRRPRQTEAMSATDS